MKLLTKDEPRNVLMECKLTRTEAEMLADLERRGEWEVAYGFLSAFMRISKLDEKDV